MVENIEARVAGCFGIGLHGDELFLIMPESKVDVGLLPLGKLRFNPIGLKIDAVGVIWLGFAIFGLPSLSTQLN